MHDTTVVISGHIPAGPVIARRAPPEDDSAGYQPTRIAPYDEQQAYEGRAALLRPRAILFPAAARSSTRRACVLRDR